MKKLFFVVLLGSLLVLAGCAQQATTEQTEFPAEDLDTICGAYSVAAEAEGGPALAPALETPSSSRTPSSSGLSGSAKGCTPTCNICYTQASTGKLICDITCGSICES